jgi:hypothetical protein
MLCLCSFFIYGCDNKKKISISTPEKDAKEMSVYHKQVLKGEMTITEFENILNSKVNMYIKDGRDRDEVALFLDLSKEIMRNTALE